MPPNSSCNLLMPPRARVPRSWAPVTTTRKTHCSFSHNGGPFPAHCIQGLPGSFFFPPVEQALLKAREFGADVSVVFKGFAPGVESFGGFQYTREHFAERFDGLPYCDPEQAVCQCCAVDWTGCFVLECSGLDEACFEELRDTCVGFLLSWLGPFLFFSSKFGPLISEPLLSCFSSLPAVRSVTLEVTRRLPL